jgi:hypothetical protein
MSAYLSAIIQANPKSFKEAMLMMDEDDRLGILSHVNTFSEEAKEIISGLAKEQNWLFDDYTEWQRNLFEGMTLEELSQKATENRRKK